MSVTIPVVFSVAPCTFIVNIGDEEKDMGLRVDSDSARWVIIWNIVDTIKATYMYVHPHFVDDFGSLDDTIDITVLFEVVISYIIGNFE